MQTRGYSCPCSYSCLYIDAFVWIQTFLLNVDSHVLQVLVGVSGGGLAVVSTDDAQTAWFSWVAVRIAVDGLGGEHFHAVLTEDSEVVILTADLLRYAQAPVVLPIAKEHSFARLCDSVGPVIIKFR